MNLLVNISPLSERLSGIGHYTKELLTCLLDSADLGDVVGFNDFGCVQQDELHDLIAGLEKEAGKAGISGGLKGHALYTLIKPLARQIPYARAVRDSIKRMRLRVGWEKYSDYVYWEPNFILQACNEKAVATIHDLSYLRYPTFHPPERVRWLEAGMEQTVSRATRLVTVSEFSKSEIVDAFPVSPQQIEIVPPGVSENYFAQSSEQSLTEVRRRLKLPRNYVLSVGTLEPRKNIKGLIDAHQGLPATVRRNFPLVLAGGKGWQSSEVDKRTARAVARGEVIRLGYVAEKDLPALYQAASLFVYPSFYEGFGMPVLEALASGAPVITSNRASLPEVAGHYALLVEPNDIDALTQALARTLEAGPSDRDSQAEAIAYARGFTWEASARKLSRLLLEVGRQ